MYQGKFDNRSRGGEPQAAPGAAVKPQRRRGNPVITAIFYLLYFAMIAAAAGAIYLGLNWLHGWLTDYERAQPTAICQQVFDELFSDPDWSDLFVKAGIPEDSNVNRETYARYMADRVGDGKLTFVETSAGLTGDKKYIVSCGTDRIGTFTLTDHNHAEKVTDIPDWQLGKVELTYTCLESVRVEAAQGRTVLINGEALGDEAILSRTVTAAEQDGYLPKKTHGPRRCEWEARGLLVKPEVAVEDKKGNRMELRCDEAENIYREVITAAEIPEAERTAALNAAHTFCLWMIERINDDSKIAKHFDRSTDVFRRICSMRESRWMQANGGYRFEDETVSDYTSYNDELCSARVKLNLLVTRKDGTVKTYEFEQTIVLTKKEDGWIATEMTNTDLAEERKMVHLVFRSGSDVLSDEYYPEATASLTVPMPEVPEGKVFSGWAVEEVVDGRNAVRLVFEPDEEGNVTGITELSGMVLVPLFEDA